MVNCKLKPAIIWGGVSFLLLYRTFPSDINAWWNGLTQWNIPVWQLVVAWVASIFPALIPLGCFIFLNSRPQYVKKHYVLIPFLAWLTGRFIITVILLFISFKILNKTLLYEGYMDIIADQLVIMYWTSSTLVSAVIIITCSYAFWRELSH